MSRNQRLSFLGIAAVIAIVAVVILTTGTGPDETAPTADNTSARQTATPSGTEEQQATPQDESTPEPTPTPRQQPPLLQAGRERTLTFAEGETARFRVRSDTDEEIHVHGYDRYVDVPAGETVNVSFEADITGIFEIELHGSGEVIGQLRIEPE